MKELWAATRQGRCADLKALVLNTGVALTTEEATQCLHAACLSGCPDAVAFLLDNGANAQRQDTVGRSPLELCFASPHPSKTAAALLLSCGNAGISRFSTGLTPLYSACVMDSDELCLLLLRNKFDANHSNVESLEKPLHHAAKMGKLALVRMLFQYGANIEASDDTGSTSLSLACAEGHVEVASYLLSKGANVNCACEKNHNTPLHVAAYNCGQCGKSLIELLISFGANVNAKSRNGFTPLHVAAFAGSLECCKLLVERGANATFLTKSGLAPSDVASSSTVRDYVHAAFIGLTPSVVSTPRSPAALARRHSVGEREVTPRLDRVKQPNPQLVHPRKRVSRERSVSTPFLQITPEKMIE